MLKLTSPRQKLQAGVPTSLVLTYTHEGEKLQKGDSLRFAYTARNPVQTKNPDGRNYTTVTTTSSAKFQTQYRFRRSITFFKDLGVANLSVFEINITDGDIETNDAITITMGKPNSEKSGFLFTMESHIPINFFYHLDYGNKFEAKLLHPDAPGYGQYISQDGKHFPDWVKTDIEFYVKPSDAFFAELIFPSNVDLNKECMLRVVIYDRYGNNLFNYKDTIELLAGHDEDIKFSKRSFDTGKDGYALLPVTFLRENTVSDIYFRIEHLGTFTANPVIVEKDPTLKIFWGDLHTHTYLSDGYGTPDFFFEYAKDIRGFDFAALADHAFGLAVKGHWEKYKKAVDKYYKKGDFATILGYEIMMLTGPGHRNVYFPDNKGKLLMADYQAGSGGSFPGETIEAYKQIWDRSVPKAETPDEIMEHFKDMEFLWTSHNCGQIIDIDVKHLKLHEVCSVWGVSDDDECSPKNYGSNMSIQKVFSQTTINPGIYGGSDNHSAKSGSPLLELTDSAKANYLGSGITAVLSKQLDRLSIYEALKNQHCYGTTTARLLIVPEVKLQGMHLSVKLNITGTSNIEACFVYKNGEKVSQKHFTAERKSQITFEWEDEAFRPYHTCYIRVNQLNGHKAWINPIPFVGFALH